MKKLSLLLTILLLFLAGCSNSNSAQTTAKAKGYVFVNNGITIAMNEKTAPILKKLGEPKDYFEAESCAFQGMEKTYTFNGFELHTYEMDKVDYVASIIFLDDSVSTKEGISLNADLNDVIKAYGDKYTKKLSLYTYQLERSKISFMIENNKVTSIEYMAITE